jgi:hypothetical protein
MTKNNLEEDKDEMMVVEVIREFRANITPAIIDIEDDILSSTKKKKVESEEVFLYNAVNDTYLLCLEIENKKVNTKYLKSQLEQVIEGKKWSLEEEKENKNRNTYKNRRAKAETLKIIFNMCLFGIDLDSCINHFVY